MLFSRNFLFNYYKYKRKFLQYGINTTQRCCSSGVGSGDIKKKILFFGTDNFSLPSLKALHKHSDASNLGVVTSFKSPANCVRCYAAQERLPLYRWPVRPEQCALYDLGVVVSFGHLIPSDIIKAFPYGMINVHASLLPRWRGAAPIIYAIMNGDTKTGVTIMKIEPHHFDVGAILAQRELPIKDNVYMPQLHSKLAMTGAELLVETVKDLNNCLKQARQQNDSDASYAPKITMALTEVDWSKQSAVQIHNRHRALFGFKALTTLFEGKQVQLLDVRLPQSLPGNAPQLPGNFIYRREDKSLLIACAGGQTHLEVLQLRLEGKRSMSASDFNNGFLRSQKSAAQLKFTQIKSLLT